MFPLDTVLYYIVHPEYKKKYGYYPHYRITITTKKGARIGK